MTSSISPSVAGKNPKTLATFILFLLVTGIELYAEYTHKSALIFFTKPLILPLISAYYAFSINRKWNVIDRIMMLAFFFSWIGDISLMMTPETPADTVLMGIPKNKYYFFVGLVSFMFAQIMFIRVYRKTVTIERISHGFKKAWLFPFFLYWTGILTIIVPAVYTNPEKNPATIPVIIYATILISMAVFALKRYGRTNARSLWTTFAGACIFVISDSLIAINFLAKKTPDYHAGFVIFMTYVLAEFLIAEGILRHYIPEKTR